MMKLILNINMVEFRRNASSTLRKVMHGQSILLTYRGKPVVRLDPVATDQVREDDPAKNLKHVSFFPEASYYPAGGASVHHFAAPGKVTLARLARKDGRYWMAVVPGEIVQFPRKVMVAKGKTVTPEWPIAFTRLECTADRFLSRFPCNHIHGCYGDWTAELLHVGDLLGIETVLFDGQQPS